MVQRQCGCEDTVRGSFETLVGVRSEVRGNVRLLDWDGAGEAWYVSCITGKSRITDVRKGRS